MLRYVSCSPPDFKLLLFSVDPVFVQKAISAGVDGIIVDWEIIGKQRRQVNADTQINRHTVEDLRNIRAVTDAPVICRINEFGEHTCCEVEQAITAGATEILVPMVRHPHEIKAVMEYAQGRCGVGMMVETVDAIAQAEVFGKMPLTRAYLRIHDLGIERKSSNLFEAIADGTVERVRKHFRMPFGFAGVTLPECGSPIPCRLLMGELARLNCQFSFLRRAFHADTLGRDLMREVPRIESAMEKAFARTKEDITRDHEDLKSALYHWTACHRNAA